MIGFELPEASPVRLDIFSVDGRRITELPHGCKAGHRIVIRDGVTYIGITPLPGSDLGRTEEVVLREGEQQDYLNSHKATAALVVLMVPIALKTAAGLGISPYALMMGIAMAASSSFTSPISHPANVLVMGPGGYRVPDYVKAGSIMTILFLVVMILVMNLVF